MPITRYVRGRESAPSDVFIATPSGSGQPRANYVASLAQTMISLGKLGIAADYCLHAGDCHVDDARNTLARQFMMTECPVLLFIDDDVGWRDADFVKIINCPDHDIVAGVYPLKQDDADYPVRVPDATALYADGRGLVEVQGAPTVFMAIRRHVIERMIEKKKKTQFYGRDVPRTEIPHTVIFERAIGDGHRWSGDYNFCREWRSLGGKVFVDPEMAFSHEGSKAWEGSLGDYWRSKHGVFDPRLDAALRKVKNGDTSPEIFGELFVRWANPFSVGPSLMATCHAMASRCKGPILETGSGITTVIIGMAADAVGGEVYSLEHDLQWFLRTKALLDRYQVRSVKLCYAPIGWTEAEGCGWYEYPPLPESFGLVLHDGPLRVLGREPLYQRLAAHIAQADWIVDDVDDPHTLEMVKRYAEPLGRTVQIIGSPGKRQFAVARHIAEAVGSSAA